MVAWREMIALLLFGALAAARGAAAPQAGTSVDFVRDVRPILVDACVRCHSGTLPQGKLRLDSREEMLRGGASGTAVIPGNGTGSLLYQRLVIDDSQKRMPWLSDPLTPTQIETVRRWIDGGAHWPEGVVVAVPSGREPTPTAPAPRTASTTTAGQRVSFNRDVRPILADNCYTCHGPDRNQRQAGLRLDREESAKAPLASGRAAIVPGSPNGARCTSVSPTRTSRNACPTSRAASPG